MSVIGPWWRSLTGGSARIDLVHAVGNLPRPPTRSDLSRINSITYVSAFERGLVIPLGMFVMEILENAGFSEYLLTRHATCRSMDSLHDIPSSPTDFVILAHRIRQFNE